MPTRKSPDIPLIIVLTLIAAVLALADVDQPLIRALFTAPLAFLFPGYAAVAALFARKPLTVATRLIFSLGLSIALIGIGGLLLHVTGLGLKTETWAILLSMVTLIGCVVALPRRPVNVVADRITINLNLVQLITLGAAVALVVIAFRIAQDGVTQQPRPGFTQLWMIPVTNNASGVALGIRNQEVQPVVYRLVMEVGDQVIGGWEDIALTPGEVWENRVQIPSDTPTGADVEALLYRDDMPNDVYRRVRLTLP